MIFFVIIGAFALAPPVLVDEPPAHHWIRETDLPPPREVVPAPPPDLPEHAWPLWYWRHYGEDR